MRKKTYLKMKYRQTPWTQKIAILAIALVFLMGLSVFALGQLPSAQTYVKQDQSDTYTKYFFSMDNCRYIFPEGSCVVDDKYCDKNSYDYQVIELEPYTKYCHAGTVVYTEPDANKAPLITGHQTSANGECEFVVTEGEVVRLVPEGYDPDPEVGPAGRLIWTFYEPFTSSGTWTTRKGDAGKKYSKVRLSDGELYDEWKFCVEVLASNTAPVLSGLRDVTAKEGDTIKIKPRCTDADGDKVEIKISGYMTSGTKTASYDDEGKHKVTVTCTDPDGAKDTKTITVTVTDKNRPPVLKVPEKVVVDEGKLVRIKATASDPDGDKVNIVYGTPMAEDGTWQTKRGDAGSYTVKVTANDGKNQVTKTVTVVVNKVNSAPKISGMRDLTVYEGDTIKLEPRITDSDGDKISVKYTGWMTSDTKKTGYDDAGEYQVTVTAKDPLGDVDSEKIRITVLNRNRPPVITKLQ